MKQITWYLVPDTSSVSLYCHCLRNSTSPAPSDTSTTSTTALSVTVTATVQNERWRWCWVAPKLPQMKSIIGMWIIIIIIIIIIAGYLLNASIRSKIILCMSLRIKVQYHFVRRRSIAFSAPRTVSFCLLTRFSFTILYIVILSIFVFILSIRISCPCYFLDFYQYIFRF